MPGRSAGSWEGRPATAPPIAPPAAAPPAIPRKFPTSLLLGRWAGLVLGRCAVPVPGLLGSCEGRSAPSPGLPGNCDGRSALPGLLGSCEGRSAPSGRVVGFEGRSAPAPGVPGLLGRSAPSGRVAGFEGRCVAPAPPEAPGLLGLSEGRCALLGRLLEGSCEALPEPFDPLPPEGRFVGVLGTRPLLGRDDPPEGTCAGRETVPLDGREEEPDGREEEPDGRE
jgi:hypothetical protein